jgi:SAM-dependent methyltransferase
MVTQAEKNIGRSSFIPYLTNLYTRFYRRIREEFFPRTHPFDVAKGVDTSGQLNLFRLAIASPNRKHGRDYQGVEPGRFADALAEISVDFSAYTFVDLGAGKGRALMMAHELGFRDLIGVEFSSRLAEIARHNLEKLRLNNVHVFVQDVAEFRFPDGPLIVFTFNSFGPEILRRVLLNLRAHIGTVYFVYVNPLHDSTIHADQFLTPLAKTRFHSVWYCESLRNEPTKCPDVTRISV